MEYQNIINLLDNNSSNQPSKFRTKNWVEINDKSCRLLTAKSRCLRGASRQPASIGSFLTICQTCLPCLKLVYGCGSSPGLVGGNAQTLKLETQL